MTKSMMIVGVGGQGSLLASRVIGSVLQQCGYTVKLSEVHGMSQRGGSVVTYVKYGDTVFAPIVDLGEADHIISFELLEAARYLPYLKPDGQIVTSTQVIYPMPVVTGTMAYPEDLVAKLKAKARVTAVDALSLAEQAGSPKAANVVLLGVLSTMTEFPEKLWIEALTQTVKPRFLEMNLRAFALGRGAAQAE